MMFKWICHIYIFQPYSSGTNPTTNYITNMNGYGLAQDLSLIFQPLIPFTTLGNPDVVYNSPIYTITFTSSDTITFNTSVTADIILIGGGGGSNGGGGGGNKSGNGGNGYCIITFTYP